MKPILLSLSALLLCGCAITQVEVAPTSNVAEVYVEPKMYIDKEPNNELFLEKEKEGYRLRHAPELSSREMIVENAMMYLGKRDGGDCSGFVNLINLKTGRPFYDEKELNASFDNARKSRAMFNLMSKKGNAYEARLPNIGDLVFFENTERRATPKTKKTVTSKTKNSKKEVAQKKPPVPNVTENITHVGIVTKVETDGTVEFIHHSNGKNILDYMNFNYPMLTHKDGKKINTYMKRCPSKNGAVQPQCMNIAFFVAYGTF
ncbi:MAG: hypothetical protein EOL93_08800 [Epsilonproteobacteria bacterium]|nr:hypothetical protein [Campylobacterota bacterium]